MRVLVLAAALVLSGCFQLSSVITVRPDGSATLRDEVTLSGMALLALAETGDEDDALFSRDEMETRAQALGGGARVLAFESREDGYTTVYAIDDISQMAYSPPGNSAPGTENLGLSFAFEAGDPSVLRVLIPKPTPPKRSGTPSEVDSASTRQALGMMRTFLGEAGLSVAVQIEGDVVDTNADVDENGRLPLYELQFGALFDAMEDAPALQGSPDFGTAMAALKDVDGVTVPTPGTLRVRFR